MSIKGQNIKLHKIKVFLFFWKTSLKNLCKRKLETVNSPLVVLKFLNRQQLFRSQRKLSNQ